MGRPVRQGTTIALVVLIATLGGGCRSDSASATGPVAPSGAAPATGAAGGSSPDAVAFPDACTVRGEATPGFAIADCTVDAPALSGNLLGDSATLDVVLWVPDDYTPDGPPRTSVYFLAGYSATAAEVARDLSTALMGISARPTDRPVIVMTDGRNSVDGSFYVDSPVTGRWTEAIASDLVGFVDEAFVTIREPAGRGIAGHSMGGFGALWIAMREPDVFGAVYALSPGLATAEGVDEAVGEGSHSIPALLDAEEELRDVPAAERPERLVELANRAGGAEFAFAYGLAFAPDPEAPALMRIPFRRAGDVIERDAETWAAWEAGFDDLARKVETHATALGALRGIGVDWGTNDEIRWIPPGCAEFVAEVRAAGIEVVEATFPGGHSSDLGERMVEFMLPFFAERLEEAA